MILSNNTNNNDAPNTLQTYCFMVDGVIGKLAKLIRNEIRDTRATSYTKNFTKFRSCVWYTSVEHSENPQHITHKMYTDIYSKPFTDDKTKLEFLHNAVNELSVAETAELKKIVRKMELPKMCRAYIIGELNKHRRQCIRSQKQH